MRRFGLLAAALAALAFSPSAAAKEFRSLAVVGARGDSIELRAAEGLVDSFFDGASRFNRGRTTEPRPARGGYVRLYTLGAGGFVGIPGRFYPETEAACFDWLQWRRPRACARPNGALLRLLRPARALTRFHGRATTVSRLQQPRLSAGVRGHLRIAFELAFDRSGLARSAPRPARCVPFGARWNGPAAGARPRWFCLSPTGAYARGRLYPLGRSIWSFAEINLLPPPRRPAARTETGPRGLPAVVAFETRRAVRTLLPNGRIVVAPPRRQRCGGTTSMLVAGHGACLVQHGGRVAILRAGREVWRSTGRYALNGVFAKLGPRVAFSYDSYVGPKPSQTLLIASLGGRERTIGRRERPLGWTRAGQLLTWRFRQGAIGVYLRSADGALRGRLATGLADIRWDARTRTLLMLTREGVLSRHDGSRRERLGEVRGLGFRGRPTIALLDGGLIGLLGRSRVAVLRRDGSLFASTLFRLRGKHVSVAGNSGLVANRAGTAVALAVTEGKQGYGAVGRESLYVLHAGNGRPARIYSHRLRFALCERWSGLSWHDDWLLYAATEGTTVAIDTARPKRRIDLTAVAGSGRNGNGDANMRVRWAPRGA